jgi:hypothetical protein
MNEYTFMLFRAGVLGLRIGFGQPGMVDVPTTKSAIGFARTHMRVRVRQGVPAMLATYWRRVGQWLGETVVDHLGEDDERPLRLRRASAILLAIGWVAFALACLIRSTPTQFVGGALFLAGLLSVALFDRRDAKPHPRRGI